MCYRGWEFWRGVVAEACEDLVVQLLQVHIGRRLVGGHGCDSKRQADLRCRLNIREMTLCADFA